MALKIGITGGIGSGKTLTCKMFKAIGVPIFQADDVARQILEHNADVREELQTTFGDTIFTNQLPDRKKIAALVFENPQKLSQLNAIIHPKVHMSFDNWTIEHQHVPYIIQEAAILFETGSWKQFDYTVLITAPLDQRINRVAVRDNTNKESIIQRINNQWPDEKKMTLASFIIENGDNDRLLPQILNIHYKLLSLTSNG